MPSKTVQETRIKAAEKVVAIADQKIEKAERVLATHRKAREQALARIEWLRNMPVDDEPEDDEPEAGEVSEEAVSAELDAAAESGDAEGIVEAVEESAGVEETEAEGEPQAEGRRSRRARRQESEGESVEG